MYLFKNANLFVEVIPFSYFENCFDLLKTRKISDKWFSYSDCSIDFTSVQIENKKMLFCPRCCYRICRRTFKIFGFKESILYLY